MCIEYQLDPSAGGGGALYYVTDVVLPLIVVGVGLVGNPLLIVVLSRRPMRRRHRAAVLVYYVAVAGVDLAALLCAVPSFLRALLPLSAAHSRSMVYGSVWIRRAVEPMLRHAAGWLTTTAAGVRCAAGAAGSSWTSLVVAFVVFVACVLLDFTRFLDAAVVELTDHCFDGVRLWSLNVTALGRRRFYAELQPAVSSLAGEALPLALSLLFALLLLVSHLRCCRRRSTSTDLDDRHDHQLSVTVFALSTAFILLDGPTAVLGLVRLFHSRSHWTGSRNDLYHVTLVARCLNLARCVVNCIVVAVVNSDFRTTLRRTFCWCCDTVACCRRARHRSQPKPLSWNHLEVDYWTTDDVFAAPAPDTGPLRQLAGQQHDNDSSLWI